MDPVVSDALAEALRISFILAVPVVLGLLVVGLLAGAFQSATLIRDPAIGYAARLAVLLAILYLFTPAFSEALVAFCQRVYQ